MSRKNENSITLLLKLAYYVVEQYNQKVPLVPKQELRTYRYGVAYLGLIIWCPQQKVKKFASLIKGKMIDILLWAPCSNTVSELHTKRCSSLEYLVF